MFAVLWNLLCFAVALGILVIVHEAGHFFAARACKVKILRFSVGFGKVLFSRTGKDGCEYSLSAIPLGGYVKMFGENDPSNSDAEGSFLNRSCAQRAFIIAAGPLSNIVLAVIFYTIINLTGVTVLRPVIGDVVPDSAAEQAGFCVYDEIVSVNGHKSQNWQDVLINLLADAGSDSPAKVEVVKDLGRGETKTLSLSLAALELKAEQDPLSELGLKRCVGIVGDVITTVQSDSPADKAGIKPGDQIVEINGVKTPSWYRVQQRIEGALDRELNLVIERQGQKYTAKVIPSYVYDKRLKRDKAFVGVGVTVQPLKELSREITYSFPEAVVKAGYDTWTMSRFVVATAYKMLSGAISPENISGPISIAKGAGESASIVLNFFISFLAAISVNLGIFNLIPIPVLDGGQLLFIAYEAIIHKKPSPVAQRVLMTAGFGILIALTVLAVFNDIRGLG